MRSSVRRRATLWAESPAQPWLTGGALTLLAFAEQTLASAPVQVTAATLLATTAFMGRRRRPELAAVSVLAVLLSFALGADISATGTVTGLLSCYFLGRRRVLHPAVTMGAVLSAALAVNLLHIAQWAQADPSAALSLRAADWWSPGLYAETLVLGLAAFAALATGDAVRARAEARADRAASQARLFAMERRQAAESERAAIARELHDLVSHSVSVIAVQAESSLYTTPDLSPQAREGFQQIAETARSSLAELRRLLGVLRTDRDAAAATAPQPTLARLGELLEQHRAVGGRAELRVSGDEVPMPTSLELSAYRIVQEALTNARRHAPGALAHVQLHYQPDALAIQISDDGPGPVSGPANGTGHGLVGMHERAALLGGTLTAGRGPAGGFLVEAELPW
ncbi:sensor histidine kinase [Streptomyces sp. NPDC088745]|uniref:sensor histidine kinase n=1 Tax=Streptomyces sp. NPDC088745 TaxID=3365884 RepID=UPI00380CB725